MRNKIQIRILMAVMLSFCYSMNAQETPQQIVDSLNAELVSYQSPCSKPCINDSVKVKILLKISKLYDRMNPSLLLPYANQALQLAQEIQWKPGMAKAYYNIGNISEYMNENEAAKNEHFKSVEIWQSELSTADQKKNRIAEIGLAVAYNSLGILFSDEGDRIKGLEYYEKSLALFKQNNRLDGATQERINIGTAYLHLTEYEIAIEYLMKALQEVELSKNKSLTLDCYQAIGNLFLMKEDNEEAIKYFSLSLDLSKELGLVNTESICYYNLGNLYYATNQEEMATQNTLLAINYFESLNDIKGLGLANHSLGLQYAKKNDDQKAVDFYQKSLEYAHQTFEIESEIRSLTSMGESLIKLDKISEAQNILEQATEKASQTHDYKMTVLSNDKLSELYRLQGKYEFAFDHLLKANVARDSIYASQIESNSVKRLLGYEHQKEKISLQAEQDKKDLIQKAEFEKSLLIRNNLIIGSVILILVSIIIFILYKRRRDSLEAQKEAELSLEISITEMKALRAQMNPHFIFNALQSIQNYLLGHKPEEANEHLVKFSKLMRLILENSKHQQVKLESELKGLELYMQLESLRLKHAFTYSFQIDEGIGLESESIPPLILQPFVENAIWHGFQHKTEAGHIDISITKEAHQLRCIICDNGVGRSFAKVSIKSQIHQRESVGIDLTRKRLQIHNELYGVKAELEIVDLYTEDHRAAGTRIELTLPLAA